MGGDFERGAREAAKTIGQAVMTKRTRETLQAWVFGGRMKTGRDPGETSRLIGSRQARGRPVAPVEPKYYSRRVRGRSFSMSSMEAHGD